VEIPAEAGIVWPPKGLFTNLNPFLIKTLYLFAHGAINVSRAGLTVLDKILFGK
jgi:hypothetical protein